jgi:uncharacterized protein YndB with AHSA1/START domain
VLEKLSMTAEPQSTNIVMWRFFDAPPSAVFEAWTTAEHVAQWWDPGGKPLALCEIDLRPGGAFRWVHQRDKGMKHEFTGTYREIAPPHRLVFITRTFPSGPESIATLSFLAESDGTQFTLTIECSSVQDRDALLAMRVDIGTARTLENLAALLRKACCTEKSK